MKTLLLIAALLSSQANANDDLSNNTAVREAAKRLINAYGYSCNRIDHVIPFVFSGGFNVVCDNYRYAYTIEDKGGNIIVKVK